MPRTFQYKFLLYNLLMVISIACAVSFYNYHSYYKDAIKNETENSVNRVQILSDRMEVAYEEMVNIVVTCSERKSLFYAPSLSRSDNWESAYIKLYASNVLKDFCAISGYSKYIYKITLFNNGEVLQAGNAYGSTRDVRDIQNAPWFHTLISRENTQYLLSLEDNPFSPTNYTPKLLPLLRPLKYGSGSSPEDAWIFLAISPRLFSDTLKSMGDGQVLYAATLDGSIISSVNGDSFDVSDLLITLKDLKNPQGNFRTWLNGKECIIAYQRQAVSGLIFFQILPISDLNLDHGVIGGTIALIFFFCFAIGLTLSWFISRQLSAPIGRLKKRLEFISRGNFDPDCSIETDDEIGSIGKQINQMSNRISDLLETRVKSEKEKRDLEIKMLQAQINPHFLYNTLDSIKWIATMQKNSGIVQVVTALSSLLKNMAKGFNEKVTLRQELDFLQNYVIIEKIRYIELFDVTTEVDQEILYDAKIVKLTLQPLVENAIFNGIEPSGRNGLIKIHVYAEKGVLYITVRDNGIGISPENIETLLTDTSRVTKSNMSGIGLPNVDRRLKLVYGEEYGLKLESKLDQYTLITIALPLEF
ncbi:sensor histidine kinase [Lacrimispora saccharolytica]|uniref:histidine kinase n=1 Tax=Lacrimispora saccharolytica (strain ATCC 35040 / DSM 2544 / NRCC 2533 / WM1) TaxID=610130 RepID=D9R053_LACSW|nr:histidine kinase [Lacrimispora saccharolytica]ADL04504.1 integral membrane sensor signal transduction histidine kinase [[Clostridium] saccharolyticum WM1]QRV21239.1 histidine kinase [Lacrimispora saccharolytica]